jgi:hypothetical protein
VNQFEVASEIVFPSGKHRGESIAEVAALDPEYLAYWAHTDRGALGAAARVFLDHAPILGVDDDLLSLAALRRAA